MCKGDIKTILLQWIGLILYGLIILTIFPNQHSAFYIGAGVIYGMIAILWS